MCQFEKHGNLGAFRSSGDPGDSVKPERALEARFLATKYQFSILLVEKPVLTTSVLARGAR